MSVYHTSFNYLNKNSNQDFGLIISHFSDGADSGETETFLSMEPVYTDNAYGTKRIDYGAKYSSVAVFRITVIKQDGSELSVVNIRNYLKWLTGSRTNSSLDLLIDNEVKYSFVGRFTNAWQYKMDARTCGLILEFTSISPWAYSPKQIVSQNINGAIEINIDNQSDDLYEYVYPRIVYKNTTGNAFSIENKTTGETTEVSGLSANEIITIDNNLMITTDKPSKTLGNNFNFIFPRFTADVNNLVVTGTGNITIEYVMYLKVGDCARDINAVSDPICSEDGTIQIDTLDWSRISNTPNTLSGYGITDAYPTSAVYNKNEINNQMQNLTDKVDSTTSLISTLSSELANDYYDKADIENSYYTKSEIDDIVYTEEEINKTISELKVDVKSNASLISNVSSELENNYYDKTDIESNYYNKSEIDNIVYEEEKINNKINRIEFNVKSNASLISNISSELNRDYYNKDEVDDIISGITYTPPADDGDMPSSIMWGQITNKPTTLAGYRVEQEVQQMIDTSLSFVQIGVDEDELNAMLTEVLG